MIISFPQMCTLNVNILCFVLGLEHLEKGKECTGMSGILLIRKFYHLHLDFVGLRQ